MSVKKSIWKKHILVSLKIAAAALFSILLAGELGLQYSATAGIITVLSIRATKRETLQSDNPCCSRILQSQLSRQ